MPVYEYRCNKTGDMIERSFGMAQAKPERIKERGLTYDRIYGAAPATDAINAGNKYPYVSSRLPLRLEGCPHNEKGKTVITSAKHEREVMAKHGYRRE